MKNTNLIHESVTKYLNPFGVWKVSTEGDEEGRTTKELGVYVGYLDFIAYFLYGEALYKLKFKKLKDTPLVQPLERRVNITGLVEVHVQLDIESDTWGSLDYEKESRLLFFKSMLQSRRHVKVEPSNYYSCVKLIINPAKTISNKEMYKMNTKRILNLTQHEATPEQEKVGVIEPLSKGEIRMLLTFEHVPTAREIKQRAMRLAEIASDHNIKYAMIGGAPFLMSALEIALLDKSIVPLYAFSRRETIETPLPNGKVIKKSIFKFEGFVFT